MRSDDFADRFLGKRQIEIRVRRNGRRLRRAYLPAVISVTRNLSHLRYEESESLGTFWRALGT